MTLRPLTLRRWTRVEYDRLVDLGVFEGDPIELIGGHLIVAEPHGTYHSSGITSIDYAIRAVLPPGCLIRIQLPVSLDDESEPEPDLVVRAGQGRRLSSRSSGYAPQSSSRWRSRASLSTASRKAASTRGQGSRTTGS